MPCRYESDEEVARGAGYHAAMKEVVPLLCEALAIVQRAGMMHQASPSLLAWKAKHDEEDRVRDLAAAQRAAKERQERQQRLERERREDEADFERLRLKLGK